MTEAEVIKALELCKDPMASCSECFLVVSDRYCERTLMGNALDLINRQKAENEKLQSDNSSMQSTLAKMSMGVEEAKAEAIKEFAERLKDKQQTFISDEYAYKFIYLIEIDNLVKEMVGDTE